MKQKFEDKYLPVDYIDSLYDQLVDYRQGTSTIDDFTERFHDLMVRCKVPKTDRQAITRYKKGLRQEIQRELTTHTFYSIEEVHRLAFRVEEQLRYPYSRRFGEPLQRRTPNTTYQRVAPAQNSTRQPPPQNSNRPAPPQNRSRPANFANKGKNVVNSSRSKQDIDCFQCKGKGHYASECPGSKNLDYAHNEEDA